MTYVYSLLWLFSSSAEFCRNDQVCWLRFIFLCGFLDSFHISEEKLWTPLIFSRGLWSLKVTEALLFNINCRLLVSFPFLLEEEEEEVYVFKGNATVTFHLIQNDPTTNLTLLETNFYLIHQKFIITIHSLKWRTQNAAELKLTILKSKNEEIVHSIN